LRTRKYKIIRTIRKCD